MDTVISVERLWKQYRFGTISHHTLYRDLQSSWARLRGREDPNRPVNEHGTPSRQGDDDYFWALRDVSFDVSQGEVLGVIGRNGAGKSTLLKLMSRITTPSRGAIKVRGRIASLLEVGTGFHPELTGRENVFLNGAILGMRRLEIRRKFDDIVSFAEIGRFIDTPVKRYSSGMYVRMAFSVAAFLDPEILVVDEVLAVGDAAFQKKCLGKMEDVARGGRTILFVSHNMASVKKLCTRVVLLEAGELVESGDPGHIVGRYLQSSVAGRAMVHIAPASHRIIGPFEIHRVEFLAPQGESGGIFHYTDTITIRLYVLVKGNLSNVRIGIGIMAEGLRITTLHTPVIPTMAAGESQLVTCEIPAETLLPNFYSVHLGAHSADTGRGLDWVPDAAGFQVLDLASDSEKNFDDKELGLVRIAARWSWHRLSEGGEVHEET